MTLQEAQLQIERNSNLIGTIHKKAVIDELVIVPSNRDNLGDIIKQVLWGESYMHLLVGHNDFAVLVLLDFQDYPNSGILLYEDLANILLG